MYIISELLYHGGEDRRDDFALFANRCTFLPSFSLPTASNSFMLAGGIPDFFPLDFPGSENQPANQPFPSDCF